MHEWLDAATWFGDEPGHCDPGEEDTDTRMLLIIIMITLMMTLVMIMIMIMIMICDSIFSIGPKQKICFDNYDFFLSPSFLIH